MGIPRIRINEIGTQNIWNVQNIQVAETYSNNIPNVYIPSWMVNQPNVDNLIPPVVVNIGNPIVDIPGCVKAHKDNKKHKTGIPIDKDLVENDPKNAMTLCPDGSYPSYDAMNYEPEQLIMTYESKAPPVAPPPEPDIDTPETPSLPQTGNEKPDCPGPTSLRIGAVGPSEKEKVVGHELQKTPQGTWVCVELYEDINIVEQYLPSAQIATTTASIAAVAGASALLAKPLADLLLRVFKPAIKQVLTKVNKALGKTPYKPTQAELKTNEYRVKKGLVGINFAKDHAKRIKSEKKREKEQQKRLNDYKKK
tara:strand:- start:36 stop:962 length:927 start_codon:yes stop_codon:yes gene_type:complete